MDLGETDQLIRFSGAAGYLKYRFNHKELIPNITIPIFELGLIEATAFLSLNGITNVTLVPSGKKFKR